MKEVKNICALCVCVCLENKQMSFGQSSEEKKAEKYLKVPFVMNKSQEVVKLVLYVKYVLKREKKKNGKHKMETNS